MGCKRAGNRTGALVTLPPCSPSPCSLIPVDDTDDSEEVRGQGQGAGCCVALNSVQLVLACWRPAAALVRSDLCALEHNPVVCCPVPRLALMRQAIEWAIEMFGGAGGAVFHLLLVVPEPQMLHLWAGEPWCGVL